MAGYEASNIYAPTWVIAVVYTVIVSVSFAVERSLYYGGVFLQKHKTVALYQALQKIKEELMLLGFISLLLTVFEKRILKICVSPELVSRMIPCWRKSENGGTTFRHLLAVAEGPSFDGKTEGNCADKLMLLGFISLLLTVFEKRILKICVSPELVSRMIPCWRKSENGGTTFRHLLAVAEGPSFDGKTEGNCADKSTVPLISIKAIHDLHIFIFALAVVHVIYCVLTVFIGQYIIRQWKFWEDSVANDNNEAKNDHQQPRTSTNVLMGWLLSFLKQFYGPVNKSDYLTLRDGFIMKAKKIHKEDPKFTFHEYMIEAFEVSFRKVVGISWYFWVFVVIFFLLNVKGWYTYFWIAFIPFIPRFVLFLIHFILFQNSFEIAFFFWIWLKAAYNFEACVNGELSFVVARLVIGVIILVLCSFNTLPQFALVITQMDDKYNEKIIRELQRRGQDIVVIHDSR